MDLSKEITIGIPVYNEVKYIRECLDSAVKQNCTIIIGDNHSTDGTQAICEEYQAKFPNIQYYRQSKNIGQSFNWKFVLDKAETPFFMWLGGHDYISENYAKNSFLGFTGDDIACVFGDLNRLEIRNGDTLPMTSLGKPSQKFLNKISSDDPCVRMYHMVADIHHCNLFHAIVRTKQLQKICRILAEPHLGGDMHILAKLAKEGKFIKGSGFYHAYRDFTSDLVENDYDPIERWIKQMNAPDSTYQIQGYDYMRRGIFYAYNSIPHDGTWLGKRKKSFYRKRLKKYLESHFGAYVYP